MPGNASQPGLTDPLQQNSASSASAAPLMPADTASVSTPLSGSAVPSTVTTAPPTSTSLPAVGAIAQALPPGTYDVSVSASPGSVPAAPSLSNPSVSVAPPPPPPAPVVVTVPDLVTPLAPAPSPAPIVSAAAPAVVPAPAPLPPAPLPTPAPAPVAPPIPDFVQQVVNLTNQFRATYGLAPLTLNIELDAAALIHSQDMALNSYVSHNGLNGSTPLTRMNQVGYSSVVYGENIAAGYDTPQEVVQSWIDSPEHRANLLTSSFTEIGIGYYYLANDVNGYYSYWTQDFGSGDLNPATYV